MKKIIITLTAACLIFTGCDDLINSMDSHQRLSARDTARALNDLIWMGFDSDDEVIVVNYGVGATSEEIYIEPGTGYPCVTMSGGGFFPYNEIAWDASFNITLKGCQGDSDSFYDGDISVHLSGTAGVVTSFDYTGTLAVSGPINGTVVLDLHYDATCFLTWDYCWNGSVNGYTIAQLYDAYFN